MNEKTYKQICNALALTTLFAAVACEQEEFKPNKGIQAGQVYEYTNSNPFNPLVCTNYVLAVKNGWVQYSNQWGVQTSTEMFFPGSRRLK